MSTVFNICNACTSCSNLSKDGCIATKDMRIKKDCEDMYQTIKYMDNTFRDPKKIKEREMVKKDLSYVSIDDMLKPFTI